ncbi:DUF748 domain-containing protein [Oleiharenicola lentus]|uniref:DUF748 domain-containing protein n=1 Tax=Oleiharenicola lentus TaxID=2508720 RepID=UPI003F676717
MKNSPLRGPVSERGGLLALLLWILGGLVVVSVIVWTLFLPRIVASTIHSKTGFSVQVDDLSVNPFTAKVSISGLVLKNPEGWPSAEFIELRTFRANADLFSLFGDRLVADEVVLDLPQLTLVRNKDGVLNAMAFGDGFKGEESASKEKKPAQQFLIKHLSLKFGKLVYADYSKSAKGDIREYNVELARELENVDSIAKIIDPFKGTMVMGLITDPFKGLFKNSPELLKQLASPIQDVGKATGEALKGLLQSLEKKKS